MVRDDEWRFYDKASDTSLWDNATKINKMDIILEDDKDIELSAILRGDVNVHMMRSATGLIICTDT